jgi:hypothetical protein
MSTAVIHMLSFGSYRLWENERGGIQGSGPPSSDPQIRSLMSL